MARNIMAVQNMSPFLMITDFPLTMNAYSLKDFMYTDLKRNIYNLRFRQTGQERLRIHSFNAAQNLNSTAYGYNCH